MKNPTPTAATRLAEPFWLRDWCVRASTHQLNRGDETLRMEPRAMAVLMHLAENAGQAVAREQLEREVWCDVVVGYDSLNNCIAKLRKALGDDPNDPRFIETIPKVGYRLIPAAADAQPAADSSSREGEAEGDRRWFSSRAPGETSRRILGGLSAILILLAVVATMVWLGPWKQPTREPAPVAETTPPLPDRPSIAVLPFANLSDDPAQAYFSDGITDDLITDLSKISGLFVIARNSSFAYKNSATDVREIARQLGVRYVLEGSVRKARDRVRINAQLVDATTGGHLWAERYDGPPSEIFDLQDRVTGKIVNALRVQLTPQELQVVADRYTDNIEAYDSFLKGWSHMLRKNPEDAVKAITLFKRAVVLDPGYHRAYAAIAQTFWDYSVDPEFNRIEKAASGRVGDVSPMDFMSETEAWRYLKEARGESSPQAHALSALMLLRQRRFGEAAREANRAISLGPSDPKAHDALIENYIYAGAIDKAIETIDDSIGLDPDLPGEKLYLKGLAYYTTGNLGKAISFIDRARIHNPKQTRYAAVKAAAAAELDRATDARAALDEYLSGWATYTTLNWIMVRLPFQDATISKRLADGLIKAGIPSPDETHFLVSTQDRLTGDEIKNLLAGKKMVGIDRSAAGMEEEFEVTRDGAGQITSQGFINYFRAGETRIENDLLCDPWWQYDDFCVAVYRNPDGSIAMKNEYVFYTLIGAFTFSVFEPGSS